MIRERAQNVLKKTMKKKVKNQKRKRAQNIEDNEEGGREEKNTKWVLMEKINFLEEKLEVDGRER